MTEREAARVLNALTVRIVVIEHIGRTAVLGLTAKRIIDLAARAHECPIRHGVGTASPSGGCDRLRPLRGTMALKHRAPGETPWGAVAGSHGLHSALVRLRIAYFGLEAAPTKRSTTLSASIFEPE
ncbi:GrpB family protein [Arthrobacter sp. R4]|uniref:GrpB family protein n=1 Tax=Arthrobacter sp. R4 TaxID=644417 RepID=UPI003ED995EF